MLKYKKLNIKWFECIWDVSLFYDRIDNKMCSFYVNFKVINQKLSNILFIMIAKDIF